MDRRSFIKSGVLATGSLSLSLTAIGEENGKENKVKLAILGTGNWGREVVLKSALASGQFDIVALCDVNSEALHMASDLVVRSGASKPRLFSSYTEMFSVQGLQAVAIVSPTHWHALQFIDACKRNLHVFLEKPVSYDIREAQAMLEAHRQARNVVQVDFPRLKGNVNKEVKAFIDSGNAGKIYQVMANINHEEGALEEKEIPSTIDFETFCGPAPRTKFLCEGAPLPMWRGQRAFSRGILFDWGIHYIHNARQILNLSLPDNVMSTGGITKNITHDNPDHLDVRFDFNGLPVCWSHKTWGYRSPLPNNNYGIYYYGNEATIFAGDMGWEVYFKNGEKVSYGDVRFNPSDPMVWQQYLNWTIDLLHEFARQVKKQSNAGITNTLDEAVKTTAAVIYADLSYVVKSSLTIDKTTMNIVNHDEAQKLLKRVYRAPYQHP